MAGTNGNGQGVRAGNRGKGRPKGSPNRDRRDFIAAINKASSNEELVGLMLELARGVTIAAPGDDEEKVYIRPPDVKAITFLLEQMHGKARQTIEVDQEDPRAGLPLVFIMPAVEKKRLGKQPYGQ